MDNRRLKKSGFTPLEIIPAKVGMSCLWQRSLMGFTFTELLVVIGIFSFIIGVSFTLLTSGRFSVNINEAQIEAEMSARQAMEKISRELRHSSSKINKSTAKRICIISNRIGTNENFNSGSAINFQVPVLKNGTLDLDAENSIKWGTQDKEGNYIGYCVDVDAERAPLLRSVFSASDGSNASKEVVARNISSLSFNRTSYGSDLITIVVVAEVEYQKNPKRLASQTLRSSVKLRN